MNVSLKPHSINIELKTVLLSKPPTFRLFTASADSYYDFRMTRFQKIISKLKKTACESYNFFECVCENCPVFALFLYYETQKIEQMSL